MIKKLLKIILFLILAIVLIIGVILVLMFDKKDINNPEVVSNDRELIEVVNNELYEDTINLSSTSKVDLLFSEVELESLVYPILKGIKIQKPSFEFSGVNFDVKDEKYSIMVSCKGLNFYKTVAKLELDFENKDDSLAIKFDEVKVGKLGLTGISKLAVKAIDEKKLQESLEKSGIYANVDLKNLKITITYENMEKTITSKMEEGNRELVSVLFDIFLKNNDILQFNLGNDNLLGAKLNLTNTKYKEEVHGTLNYNYDMDTIKNNCKKLLDDKVIDTKTLNSTFNFLVRGYKHLDEKDQEIVNGINYSSIGITDNKNYKGVIDRSDLSIEGYIGGLFKDKTPLQLVPMLTGGLMVSDDFLNGIFQSLNFVGFGYAFNDYNNNVGYFVIESLCLKCIDQKLKIDMMANINGYRLCIEVNCDALDANSNGLTITGDIKNVLLGTINLSKDEKDKLMKFLGGVLTELNWISVDVEKNELYLDFSSIMASVISDNPNVSNALSTMLNFKNGIFVEDGYISIKYILF